MPHATTQGTRLCLSAPQRTCHRSPQAASWVGGGGERTRSKSNVRWEGGGARGAAWPRGTTVALPVYPLPHRSWSLACALCRRGAGRNVPSPPAMPVCPLCALRMPLRSPPVLTCAFALPYRSRGDGAGQDGGGDGADSGQPAAADRGGGRHGAVRPHRQPRHAGGVRGVAGGAVAGGGGQQDRRQLPDPPLPRVRAQGRAGGHRSWRGRGSAGFGDCWLCASLRPCISEPWRVPRCTGLFVPACTCHHPLGNRSRTLANSCIHAVLFVVLRCLWLCSCRQSRIRDARRLATVSPGNAHAAYG